MKNNVQNILQFSSSPLEPIVALTIKKTLEAQVQAVANNYTTAQNSTTNNKK